MTTLKESLKQAIQSDRERQMQGIALPWHREMMMRKSPRDLYATLLLKNGQCATVSAKRQKDILEAYADDASMVLECLCSF